MRHPLFVLDELRMLSRQEDLAKYRKRIKYYAIIQLIVVVALALEAIKRAIQYLTLKVFASRVL